FCWSCLDQWLDRSGECPVCKAGVTRENVIPLYGRGDSEHHPVDPRKRPRSRPKGERPPVQPRRNWFGWGGSSEDSPGGAEFSVGAGFPFFPFVYAGYNTRQGPGVHMGVRRGGPEDSAQTASRFFLILAFILLWYSVFSKWLERPVVMVANSVEGCKHASLIETIMKDVYGDWSSESFPKPLPANEAGPGGVDGRQRRYLWTDAFGVLNFVTLSKCFPDRSDEFLGAARKLVRTVHQTLGTPRSPEFPMLPDPHHPSTFIGLRIGKLHACARSDPGMTYDGMYWHYIDKWLFALLRLHEATKSLEALDEAIRIVKGVHPHFCVPGRGVRWKVNVDMEPISGLGSARPNHDAETALIIYHLIDKLSPGVLEGEIDDLSGAVREYLDNAWRHVAGDPLGYGLIWWTNQFIQGRPAQLERQALIRAAPMALSPRHASSLPFRLYGGLLGAQLSGDHDIVRTSKHTLENLMPFEMATNCGDTDHSAIDKVMFAAALCPTEWMRKDSDPVLDE
ncbi:hypothetical protein FOL47_004275, partial [Perkinsus chesapeaki]